jgi:hypothetical protein
MCARLIVLFVAAGLLVGCAPAANEQVDTSSELAQLLPSAASLEGWSAAEGPIVYVPDTLYEYLDGGAERYLGYGFRQLAHLRYQHGDDLLASVTLDVYDMGGELGAFGMYRSIRPLDAEVRQWCVEGFRAGAVTSAWHGTTYVHCAADDDRPELIDMAERLVAAVCEKIPGDAALPAILGLLPQNDLVPWSERYVATDLLGHAFLPGGFLASYQTDGRLAELFFSELGSEVAAVTAMESLRQHYSRWGNVAGEISGMGDGGFACTDPALGSASVVRAGRYVAGIHGEPSDEEQLRLLERLVSGLLNSTVPN